MTTTSTLDKLNPDGYVEISTHEVGYTTVTVHQRGDAQSTITRHVAEVRRISGSGEQISRETCLHRRDVIGAENTMPHRSADEALLCARDLAAAHYPGVPTREPDACHG